ncbi:hypothetical protein [Candidatus Flexifilum breve]
MSAYGLDDQDAPIGQKIAEVTYLSDPCPHMIIGYRFGYTYR